MAPASEKNSPAAVAAELVDVAMGRRPAELVFRRGKLVNVHTAEVIENTDVAVYKGRIAFVGDAGHTIGPQTERVEADGYYLVPGFLDGHIHVESSMVTLSEFARAVIPSGTVGIFMDPHEIANVLGLEGIRLLHEEGRNIPLRVFTTIPSCVPAAPGLEDAGAVIGPQEIKEAMRWEGVVALGEMMNFPGVLNNDPRTWSILAETMEAGKTITGHYALPETAKGLPAYAAAGISSCHESTRAEDALAKLRLGMYAQLREGSAWHDIKETIKVITEGKVDSRLCQLVTDDTHPQTLIECGHLNHVVRRAIEEGVTPVEAIQMATLNTAQYYGMADKLGSIAPGRYADILMIKDLSSVKVERVYINGRLVAEEGKYKGDLPAFPYPPQAMNTVKLKDRLLPQDFFLPAPAGIKEARVRVIEVQEVSVITKAVEALLPVNNGQLQIEPGKDLAKLAVIERHRGSGSKSLALVSGFGFHSGAVASTVAHDSHNLLIIGKDERDMALAGNILAENGGGMIAVKDGEVIAVVPLPIAGLLSDQPVEKVKEQIAALAAAWRTLGCSMVSGFMIMTLLSLPVIPELRLTNRGLVDVVNFEFVDLFL
ncbi:MAG: adenine deaminase [Dethiobacteria bacterium]